MIDRGRRAKETKPHKVYNQHATLLFAYVGQLDECKDIIMSGFFSVGSIWKRAHIMNSNRGIYKPFVSGDMFVRYTTGETLVASKRRTNNKTRPYFRTATDHEIDLARLLYPKIERELKWRKGSYCESQARLNYRADQYPLTSNTEVKRRKRDRDYHRKYYHDNKEAGE